MSEQTTPAATSETPAHSADPLGDLATQLANEMAAVTKQTPQALLAMANALAPKLAHYGQKLALAEASGDATARDTAAEDLRAIKLDLLLRGSRLGVQLQQRAESAGLAVLDKVGAVAVQLAARGAAAAIAAL